VTVLWRGSWATKIRIASGLVLFVFALFHFLNIGLGLFSSELMEQAQGWRKLVTRSFLGGPILYSALLAHAGLALWKVAQRRTLRLPVWELIQITFGLMIPLMLFAHVAHTRAAHQIYGVNDQFGYIISLIWGSNDAIIQAVLMLIVWVHGCVGLHFWLRSNKTWQRYLPYLIGFSVFVPSFGLAGYLTEGRRVAVAFADPETRAALQEVYNWPSNEAFWALIAGTKMAVNIFWGLLALVALTYLARKYLMGRNSVRIDYVDGPDVSSPKGLTLLEMSRANGVPHTALCGGRGRCTTCRVVVEKGGELLHPPSAAEQASLRAVNAPPNTRLACQIRPTDPASVFRVFRPDGQRTRNHASQGQERRLAILFLDMRGFTARTTGQLPYDVVFLLNRFFDAIVPPIMAAGGTVDKYLGDGLLAVFETADEKSSALAALRAAEGIRTALTKFNVTLIDEKQAEVKIGIGIHLGDVVLGEIGAAGNAPRTLIGDTVNAASRLEGQTKELGVELLVSQAVLDSAEISTDALDLVRLELRGVTEPVKALAVSRQVSLETALASASTKTDHAELLTSEHE
jgi:adenylate cyclase